MGIAASEFEDAYEDVEADEDTEKISCTILTEPIRGLEFREPICVQSDTAVRDAATAMNDARVGCVLVMEGDRLIGIFTERDILKKVVGRLDLDSPIGQAMTPNPETVGMDDGIAYALNKMHVGGYRHIPVLDRQGRPVGVVSIRDVVRFIVSLFPSAVLNVPPEPSLAARELDGG
ncbi:Arabinose 5-phosphate isomerase KdsD [Candidatus Methylomirabilis lanthanidiphila]|uniref:Arabinose 5-phosphate isomerase KdsD n=1 Tax=Candidatus Methylomirabilis lanthanidiphila TaxID=2211376 RepID=A0A564ZM11_9BACT|nr:CBS domain-containing protein [Candidatus Methylomirabilis lanthanidiphila]VUZ86136.1 Arabinose 5-phosphate isomerase KdsD [Candidatus Methylomirabilis lanthanidiphila]